MRHARRYQLLLFSVAWLLPGGCPWIAAGGIPLSALPDDLRSIVDNQSDFRPALTVDMQANPNAPIDALESMDGCWGAALTFAGSGVLDAYGLQRIDFQAKTITTVTYQVGQFGLFSIYGIVEATFEVVSETRIRQTAQSYSFHDPVTAGSETNSIDNPQPVDVFVVVDGDTMLFIEGADSANDVPADDLESYARRRLDCSE